MSWKNTRPARIHKRKTLARRLCFILFPFHYSSSRSPIPHWPLCLLCGSVGHTVTPTVCCIFSRFLTAVENFCIRFIWVQIAQLQVKQGS